MVEPVKPELVDASQKLPDAVIEAFNELIMENYEQGHAIIKKTDAVNLILGKGVKEENINGLLWSGVQRLYERAGWTVHYFNAVGRPNLITFAWADHGVQITKELLLYSSNWARTVEYK